MALLVPQFLDAPEEHGKENGNPAPEREQGSGDSPTPPEMRLLVDWETHAHILTQVTGSGLTLKASSAGS